MAKKTPAKKSDDFDDVPVWHEPRNLDAVISLNDVWPQERDVMERPHRWKYVRKMLPSKGCVFCDAIKKGPAPESLIVGETENTAIVLNKFPYNTGHLMVIPKKHTGDLIALDMDIYLEVQTQVKLAIAILKKEYSCGGFNVGLNLGAVAGAGLPEHLHWHIVPRWAGDTNFFPLIAETKVLPESLEQTYKRLRPLFKSIGAKKTKKGKA